MNKYYNNLNTEVKEYFKILSPEFPEWLFEYIDTPEMERIGKIGMNCGMDYAKCFDIKYFYSNLDHSVGVALIIWNFTHDKKQTLAGLFHDIATPVFKHCIDFMNGDVEKQESTEERTTEIIKNSKKIMELLNRDGIKLEEINDYKIYPIADNDTPKLSADRFEYSFSSGLTFSRVWELDEIRKVYSNVVVGKNEEGIEELVFKDKEISEKFVHTISKLWPLWISHKDKTAMQFLADMCKSMSVKNYLTVEDLYKLSEQDVVNKILNCEDAYLSESFKKFQNVQGAYSSMEPIENKYCISIKPKKRYIIPLVQTEVGTKRVNEISEKAKNDINNYFDSIPKEKYSYFDFDFKPYEI